MPSAIPYERSVFINCPYDEQYEVLFHALIFAVQDCGFHARAGSEEDDANQVRLVKIKRIIAECRYGVHDLSRVQLGGDTNLPRFNMPLELGLFLGAQEYGDEVQARKRSLVLDSEPYRYQRFCSDIAGQDIRIHEDQPAKAIGAVRAMLATAMGGAARVPGAARIVARHQHFRRELAALCRELHVEPGELQFVELRTLVEEWILGHPLEDDPPGSPAPPDAPVIRR